MSKQLYTNNYRNMAIRACDVEEFANKYPENHVLLTIQKKKIAETKTGTDAKKSVAGQCTFYNTIYDMEPFGGKKNISEWFVIKNVPLKAISEPNPETKEWKRLQLVTTYSKCPTLGKFMDIMDKQWKTAVDVAISDKTIVLSKTGAGNQVLDLVQRNRANDDDEEGEPILLESPIVRFKICFDNYKSNHPLAHLRGKPKTIFKDSKKVQMDKGTGRVTYGLATVMDDNGNETAVTADNIHKLITRGCVAKKIRVHFESANKSKSGIALTRYASEVVVDTSACGDTNVGFTDEYSDIEEDGGDGPQN